MALLTAKEVMARLKVSRNTLYLWRKKEGLPYQQTGPNTIRFEWSEVEEWAKRKGK